MTITTKYDLNQDVLFIHSGQPMLGRIYYCVIKAGISIQVQYSLVNVDQGYFNVDVSEDVIYITKQELLNSLN